MKIAICDDLMEDRKTLKKYLNQYCIEQQLEIEILEYSSAEELFVEMAVTEEDKIPQIIFFDIYMSGITGMEAAKKLFAGNYKGAFIFTTRSIEHAREGYRVRAVDYLVKPYSYEQLKEALHWCNEYLKKAKKAIKFVSDRFEISIYLSDISYIETCAKNIVVHAKERRMPTLKTLTQFEAEFVGEPSFLRIDRSLIVNFQNVEKWNEEFLYFNNGERLALPVRKRKVILQQLEDYFWAHISQKERILDGTD